MNGAGDPAGRAPPTGLSAHLLRAAYLQPPGSHELTRVLQRCCPLHSPPLPRHGPFFTPTTALRVRPVFIPAPPCPPATLYHHHVQSGMTAKPTRAVCFPPGLSPSSAARRREHDGLRPILLAVRETQPKIQARPEEARGPVGWTTESDEIESHEMAAARAGGKEGAVTRAVECTCACSSICLCACARVRRDASVRHLDRKRACGCAPAAVGVRGAQTSRGDPPGAVQLLWQAPGQRHPPSHDRCLQPVAARLRSLPPCSLSTRSQPQPLSFPHVSPSNQERKDLLFKKEEEEARHVAVQRRSDSGDRSLAASSSLSQSCALSPS